MGIIKDELNAYRNPSVVAAEKEMESKNKSNGIAGKAIGSVLQMGQQMLQARETGLHVGNEAQRGGDLRVKASNLREQAIGSKVLRTPDLEARTESMVRRADDIKQDMALESGHDFSE